MKINIKNMQASVPSAIEKCKQDKRHQEWGKDLEHLVSMEVLDTEILKERHVVSAAEISKRISKRAHIAQ